LTAHDKPHPEQSEIAQEFGMERVTGDHHSAAPADDCKSPMMLTLASGIFAATAPMKSKDIKSRSAA
jgi:hypothetical protein